MDDWQRTPGPKQGAQGGGDPAGRAGDDGAGAGEVGDGKEPRSSALEAARGFQVGPASAFKAFLLKHSMKPGPVFLTQEQHPPTPAPTPAPL